MTLVNLIGHLSFIAIAASFIMRDIFWLRAVSIVGSIFSILFNYFVAGGPIWLVIGWSIVFILINTFNIFILLNDRRSISFTPEEQEMYETVFQGFSPVEFMKLLRIGQWRQVDADTVLVKEGEQVEKILFIYNGQAEVNTNGETVNYLKDGAFIGEMEYAEDKPSTATVTTTTPTRLMAWPIEEIKQLSLRNPSMQTTLQTIFSMDLMQKLRQQASISVGN